MVVLKSEKILKLIGAIDDKLLEKSIKQLPKKSYCKTKVIIPDESNQLPSRYEESLRITV